MTWVVVAVWAALSVIVAVTAGKAIDAAEHDRTSAIPHSNTCDGCGHRARIEDGLVDGWSADVDENYCPDCAAVRYDTWGYR
ncbi:MAG: hypothetical protein WBD41_17755 [Rhodococcus sp. (in: high G+C Gram-positive bacteria)]